MDARLNPKVVGSCVIGFALIAGAYVLSNFGEPRIAPQAANVVEATEPVRRVPITVTDNDNNGIEDWRDSFVSTEISLPEVEDANIAYELPDTVTGQIGVGFMEGIINSRIYAPFAATEEEVVERTVETLEEVASLELYTVDEIDIMTEWDDEDVVNYANAMAGVLINNSAPGLEPETAILQDILRFEEEERMTELITLQRVYEGYRNGSLLTPVPAPLAKAHLDLINTYNALREDIEAMTMLEDDPALTLIHLRRYQDDALGLKIALENMYEELTEFEELFSTDDPAILFVIFSPDYQPSF